MRSLNITLAVCAIAVAAPALKAQTGAPDSVQFLTAVEKRDGNSATQLVADHPTVINAKNAKGDTALILAIRNGEPDWVGFLLQKGADANLAGAGGDTPLITAAKVSLNDAAELLVSVGAKVDAANRSGETPLIIAVQQRNTRLVRFLLDRGADPDRTDAVAGYSARGYAMRDPRAREIQKIIGDKKPAAAR